MTKQGIILILNMLVASGTLLETQSAYNDMISAWIAVCYILIMTFILLKTKNKKDNRYLFFVNLVFLSFMLIISFHVITWEVWKWSR
jgi:predicted small secreted protein